MHPFEDFEDNDDRGVFVEAGLADDKPASKEVPADFEELEELIREWLFFRSSEA